MRRFSFFLGFAACVTAALLGASQAKAGSILVTDDSGGGTVDVLGTAAGATISNFNTTITEINGVTVSIPLDLGTLFITDTGGVITGQGVKTIGTGTATAVLDFSITSGFVSGSHITMDGLITAVVSNSLPGYDFSLFSLPGSGISLSISKTGTDFATVVNNAGASALNSGFGLQEAPGSVVPEPTSMSLLGIGMAGFFTYRRLFKRHATV